MAVKPSDLTREQLEKLVGDIVETLYPAANPSRQWSADTIEWVSESLAEFDLIPECDGELRTRTRTRTRTNSRTTTTNPRPHDAAFDARLFSAVKAAHDAAEAARNDTGE